MINENITLAFENCKLDRRPALLTYIVAGDSNKKMTLDILKSISAFVDICELGIPHNTPVADGKQIQNSSYRALKHGVKINDVFQIVKD
jgi:tryptophan synthase alpha chain